MDQQENQRLQLMKLLQLKLDVEKPIAYEHMQQYGLVKLRGGADVKNLQEAEDSAAACMFNLYPRPAYTGKGIQLPSSSMTPKGN